jgi:hypothetical protein
MCRVINSLKNIFFYAGRERRSFYKKETKKLPWFGGDSTISKGEVLTPLMA